MNLYTLGMIISMLAYIIISLLIRRKLKSVEDFYVAGRNAGVFLISGSMIASMNSTGTFMVDAGAFYGGGAASYIIMYSIMISGYLLGGVFWGRYIRRAGVVTIPEFFEKCFKTHRIRKLAAITSIITIIVYLISIIQGMGSLLSTVSGVPYKISVIVVTACVVCMVCAAGSKGVLITDTIMTLFFTLVTIISLIFITVKLGGWFEAVNKVVQIDEKLLSWKGKDWVLGYPSGISNILWGVIYGVSWMGVAIVAPWQGSRYLMARNESVVIKSAVLSTIGSFVLLFCAGMTSVFINAFSPCIEDNSLVMIWASSNVLPTVLGVSMLTGILAAGISSATTFLSLIGTEISNDLFAIRKEKKVIVSKLGMVIAAIIIIVIVETNPPALFIIMHFGSAIIAASWFPVAIVAIFYKNVSENSAFTGMLAGFLACFFLKLYVSIASISLPVYLDPCIVGMLSNVLAMMVVNFIEKYRGKNTQRDIEYKYAIGENEKKEYGKTLTFVKVCIWFSIIAGIFLIVLWAFPLKGIIG